MLQVVQVLSKAALPFYIASLQGKNTPFDRCCYYIKVYYCLHFCFKTNVVVKKLSKDCQKVVTCTSPLSLKQPTTYKSRRKQCHGRFLDIFSASLLAQFTESHSSAMCTTMYHHHCVVGLAN